MTTYAIASRGTSRGRRSFANARGIAYAATPAEPRPRNVVEIARNAKPKLNWIEKIRVRNCCTSSMLHVSRPRPA